MPDAGYRSWETLPLFDTANMLPAFFLDGYFFQVGPGQEDGISWKPEDGVILLQTHGPNNIVHVPYRGSKAPLIGDKTSFNVPLLADYLDDFLAIEEAHALGRPLNFCPGIWATEAFQTINDGSYLLTRPLATGIVPGISEATHPTRVSMNKVPDLTHSAATIVGQSVTAHNNGTLVITYLACFRVVVTEYSRAVPQGNQFELSIQLEEVVEGDFN